MPEDTTREETFAFRLLGLPEMAIEQLRMVLPEVPLTVRKRDDSFVVSFDIGEEMDLEPLYSFLESKSLDPRTYSVWISVTTESDQSGVSVPDHVLRVIRRTSGGVDFSFLACLG